MKRVWVPVDQWEELRFNMWGDVKDRRRHLERAVTFTGNHRLYGRYMMRVVQEWPSSCLNALTDGNLNHKAWVGQAACALALRCPEDVTRQAWGLLSNGQRILANRQADRAIQSWKMRHGAGSGIRAAVGSSLLWAGHTRRGAGQSCGIGQGTVMEGDCDGIAAQ